jgi:hypothetical protein
VWVPAKATAQKRPSCFDHVTSIQDAAEGAACAVQFVPSGLVFIRFAPVFDTAQKRPSSGDQQMPRHASASGVV